MSRYLQNIYLAGILILMVAVLPNRCLGEAMAVVDFKKLAPKSGEFEIIGYIVKQYRCPPCPLAEFCKPCMLSNVLVSSMRETLESYPNDGDYLVVFTDAPEKLKTGKSYRMFVEVLETVTTAYKANDLRLRSAVEQSD